MKKFILAARVVSALMSPFALPVVGLLIMFLFTYLSVLPLGYKIFVIALTAFYTMLLPTLLIKLYRHLNGWTRRQLGQRERRAVPYVISICCYLACGYFMIRLDHPHIFRSIITIALLMQVVCALINIWWKISAHTASVGALAAAWVAFAGFFYINPTWWLCVIILLAGMVGTSRMILRQHSLAEVVAGFVVGFVCGYIGVNI